MEVEEASVAGDKPSSDDPSSGASQLPEEMLKDSAELCDLPDELLENIFLRLSPYQDMESVKLSCRRFYGIVTKVTDYLKNNFETALLQGKVDTVKLSPNINHLGQISPAGSWATERFGHMACYYDKSLYVLGGTTHTPTTFNDMWQFDLGSEKWSRVIGSGQYPTPKALASGVMYKDSLVVFGGWSHPPPYPLMQPWRIFDELHMYNFKTKCWSLIIGSTHSPFPTAGHSASIVGDRMVVFGGRIFHQAQQAYPLSDDVWVFDFNTREWEQLEVEGREGNPNVRIKPTARYGHTQVSLDDNHILVIGGCGGPNQIFSDAWLLTLLQRPNGQTRGAWEKLTITNPERFTGSDFHYHGCKVGNSVVFFERSSPISPFLAFLQYDAPHHHPPEQQRLNFEPGGINRPRYFHSRCTSGLRGGSHAATATMNLYALDTTNALASRTASWVKNDNNGTIFRRPSERLLYSMVQGRSELVLFGGFYKDPTSTRCRVSSDIFVIKQVHKSY